MKTTIIIVVLIVTIALIVAILFGMNKQISEEEVTKKIKEHLSKTVEKNKGISSTLLTIYSEKTGYHEQFAVGKKNFESEESASIQSSYHAASIGKTMCASLVSILVDEGRINYNDKINQWFELGYLDKLFTYEGLDYQEDVTISQLLSHTSGVNDYFEGKVTTGITFIDQLHNKPDHLYTPDDLISFTKNNQVSVEKPGESFYYSDTGYILLGLILEAVEEKSYSEILSERIFMPLNMKDSYLMFYDNQKREDIIGVYIDGQDFSHENALSADWAGGGIVTTMDDLLKFMKALENGDLLSTASYNELKSFDQSYDKGISYGKGMMSFNFGQMSFLLKGTSDLYGGIGATGTYMLYDEMSETFYIANYGSMEFMKKSIQQLIQIRMIYDKMVIE